MPRIRSLYEKKNATPKATGKRKDVDLKWVDEDVDSNESEAEADGPGDVSSDEDGITPEQKRIKFTILVLLQTIIVIYLD